MNRQVEGGYGRGEMRQAWVITDPAHVPSVKSGLEDAAGEPLTRQSRNQKGCILEHC